MAESRKTQTFKRMFLVTVLLPVMYVGTLCSMVFMEEAGWIPQSAQPLTEAYQTPMILYITHELPGHKWLYSLMSWSYEAGYEHAFDK